MQCDKVGDERLAADKMDLLYGEADTESRARAEAHLAGCTACRHEMEGLRALRGELRARFDTHQDGGSGTNVEQTLGISYAF